MTLPVKTNFLNAIRDEIELISQIKKVIRNPSKPIDRETARFPVCFIFDDKETNQDRNRIQMKTFPLQIEVWIEDQSGAETIGDLADVIQAEIGKTLTDNKTVLAYGMNLIEVSSEKFYADDTLGGIVILYTAIYAHKRGDPYDALKGSNN